MIVQSVTQPGTQLGNEVTELLNNDARYTQITFVSAFVGLRTILRFRERLLNKVEEGAVLRFTIGIDLGGTSREVVEELLRWDCETFLFHNPIGRATFHPKIYLFKGETIATLFIGSNNLTDGGFYTNYEAATRYDFNFPEDQEDFQNIIDPLSPFLEPAGGTVQPLSEELIRILTQRGDLPTEREARQRHQNTRAPRETAIPTNPFTPEATPIPPLLPHNIRGEEPGEARTRPEEEPEPEQEPEVIENGERPNGVLVWMKTLPNTDALQVREGSNSVGGVRLTQARFEDSSGERIDQTTYFRNLFSEFLWENEQRGHADQEHTFVPMRIFIRGTDYGIHNFEVSHKPSGEAGQANYTTILRWGRNFSPIIKDANLTGATFSLYETPGEDAPFFIDITA